MSSHARVSRLAVAVLAAAVLAGGCLSWTDPLNEVVDVAVGVQAHPIGATLEVPGSLVIARDSRVFYTERSTGRIRVIKDGVLLDQAVAEVPVNYANDRGALGLALHPSFAVNNRLYLFYSRSSTGQATNEDSAVVDHRVVYFVLDGDVASGGEFFVASIPATGSGRRVGGRIAFAVDTSLYVAIGDQEDPNSAKDPNVLAGKVLRYTQDGGIPATNPVANSPVFARGFRHPLGLTVDAQRSTVFLIDRNDGGFHEINRVTAGGFYGWPEVVGLLDEGVRGDYVAANPDYVDPLLDSGSDSAAYIGVAVNPAGKYGASLTGRLIAGIGAEGRLLAATLSAERDAINSTDAFAAGFPNNLADVAASPTGVLYVATSRVIYVLETFPYPN